MSQLFSGKDTLGHSGARGRLVGWRWVDGGTGGGGTGDGGWTGMAGGRGWRVG